MDDKLPLRASTPGVALVDPALARRVTDNYGFWQGLRVVPFGVMLVLTVLLTYVASSWYPDRDWVLLFSLAALFAAAYAVMRAVGRCYERVYGQVWERTGAHRRRTQVKWMVAYPLLCFAAVVDAAADPPVLITPSVLAAATVAYWASTGRGRLHYLAMSAMLACLALLPQGGVRTVEDQAAIVYASLGVGFVVVGTLDHRSLRRIMGSSR